MIVTDAPRDRRPQRRRGRACATCRASTWSRSSATATASRRCARTRSWPWATASRSRATSAGSLDLQEMRGLASAEERHFAGRRLGARPAPLRGRRRARAPSLVGSTLKEAGFRGRYGGAVIAIHRAERARRGQARRRARCAPGDVLLVLAGPAFRPRALDRRDFLVVAALDGERPAARGEGPARRPRHRRAAGAGRHRAARHPARRRSSPPSPSSRCACSRRPRRATRSTST